MNFFFRIKHSNRHNKHLHSLSNRYFSSLTITNFEYEQQKKKKKKNLNTIMYYNYNSSLFIVYPSNQCSIDTYVSLLFFTIAYIRVHIIIVIDSNDSHVMNAHKQRAILCKCKCLIKKKNRIYLSIDCNDIHYKISTISLIIDYTHCNETYSSLFLLHFHGQFFDINFI